MITHNTRRKLTNSLRNTIKERMADKTDGGEVSFCIDSKTIEVFRIVRSLRCRLGKSEDEVATSFGIWTSQNTNYYG